MNINYDLKFMELALKEASKALTKDEVPIGAVIIYNNKVISKAYNSVEKDNCQSRHAEVKAIEKACKKIDDWRLENCTIYVTLEPCAMCLGLIGLSRISRLVYGAKSPLFGLNIDQDIQKLTYNKHLKNITKNIMEKESINLLKLFFKKKRGKYE